MIVFFRSSSIKLAEMQALYQVENKEQKIRQLDLQKKTQEKELDSQRKLALNNGSSLRFHWLLS